MINTTDFPLYHSISLTPYFEERAKQIFQQMKIIFDEKAFRYNYDTWLGRIIQEHHYNNFPYKIQPTSKFSMEPLATHQLNIHQKTLLPIQPVTSYPKKVKPRYLVIMPSKPLSRKRFCEILDAVASQSFGLTESASKAQMNKRLKLILGVNKIHSLDIQDNLRFVRSQRKLRSAYQKWSQIEGNKKFCFIHSFFWSPWKARQNHPDLYCPSLAYHLFVNLTQDSSLQCYFHERLKNVPVPYQEIRDEVMHSPAAAKALTLFRQKYPHAPQFMASLDADFVQLKTSRFGLYSYYDRLNHFCPDFQIASTGYLASPQEAPLIQTGVYGDMDVRKAMSGLAVYYPEPNFVCRIFSQKTLADYSWYKKGTKDTESRRFIENCSRMPEFNPAQVFFIGPEGAIYTEIDEDWKTKKAGKMTCISSQNIYQKQVLSGLLSVKQSHLDSQICAHNLYSSLNLTAPDHFSIITPMKSIFNIFCPIHLCFSLKENNQYKTTFLQVIRYDGYLHFSHHLRQAFNNGQRDPIPFVRACNFRGANPIVLSTLFLRQLDELNNNYRVLLHWMTPQQIIFTVDTAFRRGNAIYQYLNQY